jgi:hypothetical protein
LNANWYVSGFGALLWSVTALNGSSPAASASRCLTPAAETALRDTISQPAFQRVLENGLRLEGVHLLKDQIELEVHDRTDQSYRIALVLPESKRGEPDAAGGRFLFYLAPAASPVPSQTKAALLAAAAIVDQAIPDAALVRCGQSPPDEPSTSPPQNPVQPPAEQRYPLALALLSAGVQVIVILGAILFGVRAVRRVQ